MARRPLEKEQVHLDGGRRTTQLMRDSLGGATVAFSQTFRRRLLTFVLTGAGIGVGFSLLAAAGSLTYLFSQPPDWPTLMLLGLYPVAGAAGGVLVAISFPLTRWLGGAFLVGAIAFLPVFLGVELITEGRLGREQLELAATGAIILGGAIGAAEWFNEPRRYYRLAHYWLFAIVCTAVAWFMGLHWAGQWQAMVAIPLFLIPVAFALMATIAKADG
ncbi:MAG TPA: hypothetical protein VFI79_11785 [Gemmatimonadales bacterium]|nr:hypothetical protein [Gemmatimonadales bacterium]